MKEQEPAENTPSAPATGLLPNASASPPARPAQSTAPAAADSGLPNQPLSPSAVVLERRPIKGLIISGSILFAGTWLLTTSIAYGVFGTKDTWPSAIPLFGPFIQMGNIHSQDPSLRASLIGLLGVSGLWQFAGLGMVIGGAIGRKVPRSPIQDVALVPLLTPNQTGLVLLGAF